MNAQLTQKERMFLEDLKKHEELCVAKYPSYANQSQDQALSQMFNKYAAQEQAHLDTINQILNGQMPNMNQGQSQQGQQQAPAPQPMAGQQPAMMNQGDAMVCVDMLATEKNASSGYDTAVFEVCNPQLRQTLQHIQKEEQQHGEGIKNYMIQHGMVQMQ